MQLNRLSGYLLILLVLCVGASFAGGRQQQLPVSHAVTDAAFNPEQTAGLAFSPYEPGTRLPFSQHQGGIVLRVQLPDSVEQPEQYNLVFRPRYLQEVTAWFRLDDDPSWQSEVRGRLLANQPAYYSTLDLVYELPEDLDASQPLYFVVRDRGSPKAVSIDLTDRQAYLLGDVAYSRSIAALYAIVVALVLVNLIFYSFVRESPFLWYSVFMLLALNALLWQEGWIGKILYLPDSLAVDRWLHFFSMLPAVLFYQFYRSYLGMSNEAIGGKMLLGFQWGLAAIILFSQLHSFWSGEYIGHIWVNLFNGFLALGAVGVFAVTLAYWMKGYRLASYLFAANLVLVSATLIRIAYTFGVLVGDTYWQTHAIEIALAIDAVLLSLALADRTLSIKKERDQTKVDLVRVDTAFQREQLLADFVRSLQSGVTADDESDAIRAMDKLLFNNINRIVEVAEVMVLTRNAGDVRYRCLGGNRILGKLLMKALNSQLPQLMKDCRNGLINRRNIRGFPDARERYQCLMIPVKVREATDYCLLLLIPRQIQLDRDLVSGLREFVEKAVHALMDAENVERLRHSARYDDLTGVLNRASIENNIAGLLSQCNDMNKGLALVFVDIDYFKELNDSMGHDYGDDCLRYLCRSMQQILPRDGLIGRFGGDEFLVLLPDLNYQQAREYLEKLNPLLAKASPEEGPKLSASIGIAECLPGQRISKTSLFKLADMSLYAAKAAGRACIGPRVAKAKTG
ncbi:sensor domain-containing diguanylate cyclase [Thiolapillus sp.]